mmetsp:Transcript_33735/g.110316  ORF Transcript_33735/g.110316 Transcript_33735/m.110316 type:complete len:287 (+) Transcript_33735:208-1068(+)
MRSTTRSSPPRWRTSCSQESSKTSTSPSLHSRHSLPARIEQPGGMTMPRCAVRRVLVEPQCGRKCVPGLSVEKSVSPPPAIASPIAAETRSIVPAVTGQRAQFSAYFWPLPKSGYSRHSPAATRVWSCAARPPTGVKDAGLRRSRRTSSRICGYCSSSSAHHANSPLSHHGLDVSRLTRWGGRCIQLAHSPAATPPRATASRRRRATSSSGGSCCKQCTPLTCAPWWAASSRSVASYAPAASEKRLSCISTTPTTYCGSAASGCELASVFASTRARSRSPVRCRAR